MSAVMLLAVILISLACGRSGGSSASGRSPTATPLPIRALAQSTAAGLRIVNDDSVAWTNVAVDLNYGFTAPAGTIRAGASQTIPWGDFAEFDGTRFNVFTTKPQTVKILSDQGAAWGNLE